jgi:guanylate kinase
MRERVAGEPPPREGAGEQERPAWVPDGWDRPLLVVLSGPAGVGKTTVLRRMKELGLPYRVGITATTRTIRPGETDGVDYFFYSFAAFDAKRAAGEFLEYAQVHGVHWYGVPRGPIRELLACGHDVIIPPEVQGAATLRAAVPGVLTIFLAAPSFEDLEGRIRRRAGETGESEEEIQRRLATARAELARLHEFDYLVINEEARLDATVHEIDAIITAEKRRVHRPRIVI